SGNEYSLTAPYPCHRKNETPEPGGDDGPGVSYRRASVALWDAQLYFTRFVGILARKFSLSRAPRGYKNETPDPRSNGKPSIPFRGGMCPDSEASQIAGEQMHIRGDSSDDCCHKRDFLGTPLLPAPGIISQTRRASTRSTTIIPM